MCAAQPWKCANASCVPNCSSTLLKCASISVSSSRKQWIKCLFSNDKTVQFVLMSTPWTFNGTSGDFNQNDKEWMGQENHRWVFCFHQQRLVLWDLAWITQWFCDMHHQHHLHSTGKVRVLDQLNLFSLFLDIDSTVILDQSSVRQRYSMLQRYG
jgi:hypothetical protein